MSEPRIRDRTLWRLLLGFMYPHRKLLGLTLLLLLFGFAADLTAPYLIRITLDGPVSRGLDPESSGLGKMLREVLPYGIGFLAVMVCGALLRYLEVTRVGLLGQRVALDVRSRLFDRLLHLPQKFFDRRPVGELVTRCTSDVDNLVEFFSSGVAAILFDVLRIIGVLIFLFVEQPLLASIVLAALPVYAIATFRFRRRARVAFLETRTVLAKLNAFVQESLQGIRVTQLTTQEANRVENFSEHGGKLFAAWRRTVFYFALFFPMVDILSHLVLIASFLGAGWMILQEQLTIGQWVQYWFYLHFLLGPLRELSERYNVLQSALSSAEKISGILKEPLEPDGTESVPLEGKVDLEGITLRYGDGPADGPAALKDLSVHIKAGETVALVGTTGSGKTSLAHLVLSLYRSQEGTLSIDDLELSRWRLKDLRRGIGMVPQEVFLFAETILENVRLGDPDIEVQRVEDAIERVGAAEFVHRLPEGIHTRLGERGVNLSVGQRQLLAMARVLVHDPRILILDEATSSVDTHSEELLQRAIDQVLRGRTTLVIAHRLSTVRKADRILVLHHGELRESGTHRELLEQGGIYSRLHQLQFRPAD